MSTNTYTLYGSEMSPYSHKVRSYMRYKRIAHRWVPSGPGSTDPDYKKHARVPIVPTLVSPDGVGQQDSTPILETLDQQFPEPGIHPPGALLGFVSTLLEEFGDEWGNKLMFSQRWYRELDMAASCSRAAILMLKTTVKADLDARAALVRGRMSGRGHFVGSSDATAPLIERYYVELLDLLQPHFGARKYLFGARPSFADFALYAQLFHAASDPTGGAGIRARGPAVLDWCLRMVEPREDGPFEDWSSLAPTMTPLLAYVGRYFLPWSQANADALARGADTFSVELAGEAYTQPPQKYHAKSLAALKQKYQAFADNEALGALMLETGCAKILTGEHK
ncbi:MAG TPA: glutathione S-transferase [Terricaulis sp.]|nr:glutathione S-transferase [Terricaulis sp.]